MEDIHEWNYQQKGYNKYVIDYTVEGYPHEKTLKAFDRSEAGAKKQIKRLYPGLNLKFTHIYICWTWKT